MLIRLAAVSAFLVIMGCAHLLRRDTRLDPGLLPPTATDLAERPDADNSKWFRLFRAADEAQRKDQRETACLTYRELLSHRAFPLHELVLLRAHQVCPFTEDLPVPWRQPSTATAWFAEDVFRAKEAEWAHLPVAEQVAFLWDKAAIERGDRKRETLLADAVGFAEKSGDEALIAEAQNRLWKNSPRLRPNPTKADLPAIAADWRRWREFDRSVSLERSRLKDKSLTDDERFAILKSIRQTWKTAQNKTAMLTATTELLNFSKASFRRNKRDPAAVRRLLEAWTLFARTVWTENRRDLAERALNDARRELAGRISLEEVHFILGRIKEEAGDLEKAEGFLTLALNDRPMVTGLKEKIRWARAWVLHKAKRDTEARVAFLAISLEAKDPSDRSRGAFWAARSAPESERIAALNEVRRLDPLGFYGLMATRDLKEPLPPLTATAPPAASLALTSSTELSLGPSLVAEWLIALEVKDGTARVIDTVQEELKRNPRAGTDAWLRVASAYARAGEYLPLFGLMSTLTPETRDRLLQEQPDLLFPKPWLTSVEKAGAEAGVPPELIFSIIRQESAFNPRARSHADAFGLTQLLPSNAARHAGRRGIPYKDAHDLFDPEVSIRVGAWELRGLFDRWGGRWIPSVASYNASADAVRGWLKHRRRDDPVEFIEEIPYEETRAYVKLVMRNQVFYQRMLSSTPTFFPENCLNLGEPIPR